MSEWGKCLVAIGGLGVALAFMLVITLIFALPTMLLWNWLVPTIFGLPEIGWIQAAGLGWLVGFLTSGKIRFSRKGGK